MKMIFNVSLYHETAVLYFISVFNDPLMKMLSVVVIDNIVAIDPMKRL